MEADTVKGAMLIRALLSLAALSLFGACGGRYERSVADDGQGSGGGLATAGTGGRVGDECSAQRQSYLDYRESVIDEQVAAALPCETADQCGLFYDLTGCASSCGIAIPNSARRGIDDRLYAYAEMACSGCASAPPLNCMSRPDAVCIAGRCQ